MYIGKEPIVGNFQKCDAITVVNGQAAYTLQVGSTNVSPESVNHMIVSLNGVIQSPTTAYTVSGATLTFASNLATGDVIDFILLLGNVLSIGTPSDNVVSTAKIVDDAVTLAKMAAGTDGNIISYDASGNPVAIATGNDGQVLTSAGAGQPPAFETLSAGKVGQVVMAEDKTGRTTTSSTLNDMSSSLIAQITPSATNSKILVTCCISMQSSTYSWYVSLYRDIGGAGYGNLTDAGSYNAFAEVAGAAKQVYVTMHYLDSPSTTSQCSYRPYGGITGSGTLNMNMSSVHGTISAMEILA